MTPLGSRRGFEHPHMRGHSPGRAPVSTIGPGSVAPSNSGGGAGGGARGDWIPKPAYSALREAKDSCQKILDNPADAQNAASVARALLSKVTAVVHQLEGDGDDHGVTFSEPLVPDDGAGGESEGDEHKADGIDEYDGETERIDELHHIAAVTSYDAGSREAALVQQNSDAVQDAICLQLESMGGSLTPEQISSVVNRIVDDMPITLQMTETEEPDELTLSTRILPLDVPTSTEVQAEMELLKLSSEFFRDMPTDVVAALLASNYDSCGSQCFETSRDSCIPGSFRAFGDDGPKIQTTVGKGAADGMALKRVHLFVTPEIKAMAMEHGVDLNHVDVFTILVPPIIASQFTKNYSILGGPICKSIGMKYVQEAWCHSPDHLVVHESPDLKVKCHHKRNGLPYVLLVPDAVVQSRRLVMYSPQTLTPYSDAEAMAFLKQKWDWHDPSSHLFGLVEECYATAMAVAPPRPIGSSIPSYLEAMDNHIDACELPRPGESPQLSASTDTETAVPAAEILNVGPEHPTCPARNEISGTSNLGIDRNDARFVRKFRPVPALRRSMTIALIGAGLCSSLYFSDTSGSNVALPLKVAYIIEPLAEMRDLAVAEAKRQGYELRCYENLVDVCDELDRGDKTRAMFAADCFEFTLPCTRETVMAVHNHGKLIPLSEHSEGFLFVSAQFRLVKHCRPRCVLNEMTGEHSHSDGSHRAVAKAYEELGYYVNITNRLPSCFCGDRTDRSRWFLIAFTAAGPPFDLVSYCSNEYHNASQILDPIADVSPELWQPADLEFRSGPKPSVDDPTKVNDPYHTGQFINRSVLAGWVGGRHVKEDKFWQPEFGPLPCITRYGLQLHDRRDPTRPVERCVRYASVGECARATSFFDPQVDYLVAKSRLGYVQCREVMTRIAGAVCVGTLHTVYSCVLDQLVPRFGGTFAPDNADVFEITSDVDPIGLDVHHSISTDAEIALGPEIALADRELFSAEFFRHSLDLHQLETSGDWVTGAQEELLDVTAELAAMEAVYGTFLDEKFDGTSLATEGEITPNDRAPEFNDTPLKVVSGNVRRYASTDHIPTYAPPSKEFYAAVERVRRFHAISHERDPAHIDRIAATTTGTGLKPGDGRYACHIDCDGCNRTIDHVQRTHVSAEQGTARAPPGLKVGSKWMLDGGDATVVSIWGGYRYFLVFIEAKSQYVVIYYMRDNSAKSFVAAVKYLDRLVRVRKGYGVSGFYGDYFSTHLDQNVLGALR